MGFIESITTECFILPEDSLRTKPMGQYYSANNAAIKAGFLGTLIYIGSRESLLETLDAPSLPQFLTDNVMIQLLLNCMQNILIEI